MTRIDIRPVHSSEYEGRMGPQSLLKFEEKPEQPKRERTCLRVFLSSGSQSRRLAHTPNSHMQGPLGSTRKQGPKGSSNGWPRPPCQSAGSGCSSLPAGPELLGQGWHLEDPVLEHKASLGGLRGVRSGQSCPALAAQLGCGEVRELRCWVLDWSPFILPNRVGRHKGQQPA